MRMFLRIMFFSIILFGLLSCEDNIDDDTNYKLSSVEYTSEPSVSKIVYNVHYKNDLLVQFGNSKYYYDSNGKVIKEEYDISKNNPEHISSSAQPAIVTFSYLWDNQGKLKERKVIENTEINPASIYRLYINESYTYNSNNYIDKVEYFDSTNKLVKSINYYYSKTKLDSIIIINKLYEISKQLYDRWNTVYNGNTKVLVHKTIKDNPFRLPFKSLGFLPRDLENSFYLDSYYTYLIEESEFQGIIKNSKTYSLDNEGRLSSIISLPNRYSDDMIFTPSAKFKFNY